MTKQTKYSLRALYALANSYGHGPRVASELAREERIPAAFLQRILWVLKSAGIVDSRGGLKGGFELKRPPESITLGSVVRIFEGRVAPLKCVGTESPVCEDCINLQICGTRLIMDRLAEAAAAILDQTTLADVNALVKVFREDSQGVGGPMHAAD